MYTGSYHGHPFANIFKVLRENINESCAYYTDIIEKRNEPSSL